MRAEVPHQRGAFDSLISHPQAGMSRQAGQAALRVVCMPHRAIRERCALGSSCSVLNPPSLHTAMRHWLHGQLSGLLSIILANTALPYDPNSEGGPLRSGKAGALDAAVADRCMHGHDFDCLPERGMGICPAKPVQLRAPLT